MILDNFRIFRKSCLDPKNINDMKEFTKKQFILLGQKIAVNQDAGLKLSVEELEKLINTHKLISWIETNVCILDLWDRDNKKIMNVEFESLLNAYGTLGIENNGLSLLIFYCFVFVDKLPTRTLDDL